MNCRLFTPLAMLLLAFTVQAQQVKITGTQDSLPLKTVVIRDSGSENAEGYLQKATIVRFWVFKAGSTADVEKIVKTFRSADGVKELKEGEVNGDYKEFVLHLNGSKGLSWYKKHFAAAGLTHLKFNSGPVRPLSQL